MVSTSEEQPVYVAVEVFIKVNIWVGNDFNPSNAPTRPVDVAEHGYLQRIWQENPDTPSSVLTAVQVEDMAARCVQKINARLIDKL